MFRTVYISRYLRMHGQLHRNVEDASNLGQTIKGDNSLLVPIEWRGVTKDPKDCVNFHFCFDKKLLKGKVSPIFKNVSKT